MSDSGEDARCLFGPLDDDLRRALDAAEDEVVRQLGVQPGHYYRSIMIGTGSTPSVKMAHVIEVAVRAVVSGGTR